MVTAFTPPWPLSGYGALPTVASFEDSTHIWLTDATFDDPEDAVEAAAEAGESFFRAGFPVTGVGFEIVAMDEATMTGAYKGYVTFAGRAPEGSVALGGEVVTSGKAPWWHYGLAATGGFLFAGLVVAVYNAAVK